MHFTARGAGDGDPSTLSVCVCVCGVCAHVCNVVLNLIASREARCILQPGGVGIILHLIMCVQLCIKSSCIYKIDGHSLGGVDTSTLSVYECVLVCNSALNIDSLLDALNMYNSTDLHQFILVS